MEKRYIFDYYYGAEAEQFSFFRVPKILFKEKRFKNISTDAKILYGMMLDRMSLSRQNNWIDEQNRVYIIYTLSEIMDDLACGKDKGVHLIAELDERGIGLIERRKQGFGKPALIYVKNFISSIEQDDYEYKEVSSEEETEETEECYDTNTVLEETECQFAQSLENSGFYQTSEKPKSRGAECRSRDFGKTEVMTSEKPKSRGRKNRSLEVGKTEVNDTNINNTDIIDTNINNTYINPPPQEIDVPELEEEVLEELSSDVQVFDYIKRIIEYDRCMYEIKTETGKKQVNFLLDLICDVVAHSRLQIRIGGKDLPYQNVRDKFLRLKAEHVIYVANVMQAAASRLNNPSSYALTALYNVAINATIMPAEENPPEPIRFEEFWENFPLKVRKLETESEYINLISGETSEAELVEAAKNYAQEVSLLEKEKVCYPANFLARGVYRDYMPGVYTPPKNTKRQLMRGEERNYSREEMEELERTLLKE